MREKKEVLNSGPDQRVVGPITYLGSIPLWQLGQLERAGDSPSRRRRFGRTVRGPRGPLRRSGVTVRGETSPAFCTRPRLIRSLVLLNRVLHVGQEVFVEIGVDLQIRKRRRPVAMCPLMIVSTFLIVDAAFASVLPYSTRLPPLLHPRSGNPSWQTHRPSAWREAPGTRQRYRRWCGRCRSNTA